MCHVPGFENWYASKEPQYEEYPGTWLKLWTFLNASYCDVTVPTIHALWCTQKIAHGVYTVLDSRISTLDWSRTCFQNWSVNIYQMERGLWSLIIADESDKTQSSHFAVFNPRILHDRFADCPKTGVTFFFIKWMWRVVWLEIGLLIARLKLSPHAQERCWRLGLDISSQRDAGLNED